LISTTTDNLGLVPDSQDAEGADDSGNGVDRDAARIRRRAGRCRPGRRHGQQLGTGLANAVGDGPGHQQAHEYLLGHFATPPSQLLQAALQHPTISPPNTSKNLGFSPRRLNERYDFGCCIQDTTCPAGVRAKSGIPPPYGPRETPDRSVQDGKAADDLFKLVIGGHEAELLLELTAAAKLRWESAFLNAASQPAARGSPHPRLSRTTRRFAGSAQTDARLTSSSVFSRRSSFNCPVRHRSAKLQRQSDKPKKKFDTSWLAQLDNSFIAGTTKERSPITAILVSTWDVNPSAKRAGS
jgi:hypothetical protein